MVIITITAVVVENSIFLYIDHRYVCLVIYIVEKSFDCRVIVSLVTRHEETNINNVTIIEYINLHFIYKCVHCLLRNGPQKRFRVFNNIIKVSIHYEKKNVFISLS